MNWDDLATVSRFVDSEPNPRLVAVEGACRVSGPGAGRFVFAFERTAQPPRLNRGRARPPQGRTEA
jgi:hypothetical protein